MFLRFIFLALGISIVVFAVQQLILPALLNQPVLSLFRGESRLDRARRLKREAADRKEATVAEIETIQMEEEAKKIRDAAFEKLTRSDKA